MRTVSALSRLDPDSPEDCPDDLGALAEFATLDSGCDIEQSDMEFLRTARIGRLRAWVWRFYADGDPAIAMVAVTRTGRVVRSCLFEGLDVPAPLDIDQVVLADFGPLAQA